MCVIEKHPSTKRERRVQERWAPPKARTVVIVLLVFLLLGSYLVVELIALSANLDDIYNGNERE